MLSFKLSTMLAAFILLGGLSFSTSGTASDLNGYVMQVQMTPAVCSIDRNSAKRRKCLEGYALTISALLPETSQKNCTVKTPANLSPLQTQVVGRIMPEEQARNALWQSVGSCVPMTASQYFRTMINFAERLKIPPQLTSFEDQSTTQNQLRAHFLKINPSMPNTAIQFNCQRNQGKTLLTELQVCYRVDGRYKQCSKQLVSNCPNEFVIKGTY